MTDPAPGAWWARPDGAKSARPTLPELPTEHGPVATVEHGEAVSGQEWVPAGTLPEGKPRKPWGLGDAVLGLLFGLLLSSLFAVAAIALLVVTGGLAGAGTEADILSRIDDALTSGPTQAASLVGLWVGFMIAIGRASRRKGTGRLSDDFGLRFDWRRDILIGAVAAAALRLAELGINWLLAAVGIDISGADNVSPLTSQTGFWLIVLVVFAGLGAPFFEELFFRGLFLRAFARRFNGPVSTPDPAGGLIKTGFRQAGNAVLRGTGVLRAPVFSSVLLSSVVFGLMHAQGTGASLIYIVSLTAAVGAVLAVMAVKTGRLGPSICTHVAFNTSGVLLALWLT